jgi:RND family efflux transporter MFP subunit
MVKRILNLLLALGIVGGAVAIAWMLFVTRPQAAQAPLDERALPVEVLEVRKAEHGITVKAMGEVKAAAELLLQPEVSGKVLALSPNLVPGGRVTEDELLVRVDKRDYGTMLAAQQAALEQAAVRREEEKSLKKIAEYEWQGADVSDEARQLALREPHLRSAAAQLQSAQSQLKKARRDIKKTVIRAPFEGIVLEEYVDLGQIVAPGVTVARIAGTHRFWVQISVPVADLSRLRVPGVNSTANSASLAKIILEPSPGTRIEREGHVEHLLGSVDPRGRMAQLLVAVDDPLELQVDAEKRTLPLLIGSYVKLELEGRALSSAVALPIEAVDDKGQVWVVENDTLQLREVEVAWRETETALVTSGLADGDRVVVSPVPTATRGMPAVIEKTWDAAKPGPLAAAGSD